MLRHQLLLTLSDVVILLHRLCNNVCCCIVYGYSWVKICLLINSLLLEEDIIVFDLSVLPTRGNPQFYYLDFYNG